VQKQLGREHKAFVANRIAECFSAFACHLATCTMNVRT
jgi:hypothetical protein